MTAGSDKKIVWQCHVGHEWKTSIYHRARRNHKCPLCSKRRTTPDNCLAKTHPHLAKEWHPTKNGNLTPNDVTAGSGRKAWWQCEKKHEWKAVINSRSQGIGCPYCSNKSVCADNCLATTHPYLVKEWHPTKNGTLTPENVVAGSGRKAWWKCSQGHEWRLRIVDRLRNGCRRCYAIRRRSA